jgi:dipeptidyl aminopeptidase/acylaminoacyl peptidase
MGNSRMIEWRSLDGDQLHGALLLPANYRQGVRYPLIVDVYGGATLSDVVNRFGFGGVGAENMQILATRGYAVLFPDSPLSQGTPLPDLLKTVMPGVNQVVEMGIADPDRLGLTGHSYGGYSTLALLVQTRAFRAAVDSAGVSDLVSDYTSMSSTGEAFGIGWLESGQGGIPGTPWQYRSAFIENSPLFYLDRVQTPLLLIHGALDEAVPPSQGEAVFVGLRRLGKEVVYVKYAGEGHWEGEWGPDNVVDYWQRVISWFDTHVQIRASK